MLERKMKEKERKRQGEERGNKIKIQSGHTHKNTICLACMKRCHSSGNRGIWMPHVAAEAQR